jgi:DNA-binding transcriptional MerR regulator
MAEKNQPSKLYSITELERLTGVPRRTIHYYVKEGMIPPPEGLGRKARYSEEHRLRLALIKEMKASTHLRLAGIREIIDPMDETQLRHEVERLRHQGADETNEGRLESTWEVMSAGPPDDHVDLEDLKVELVQEASDTELDETSDDAPDGEPRRLYMDMASESSIRRSKNLFSSLRDRARMARHDSTSVPPPDPDAIDADAWNRVRVDDNVEIHYRSTGDDEFVDKIKKLVAFARKLLG